MQRGGHRCAAIAFFNVRCDADAVDDHTQVRASEWDKWWLRWQHKTFMDVTDHPHLCAKNAMRVTASKASFPDTVHYEKQLRSAFKQVSERGPRADLDKFTSFFTRYYRSESGRRSQKWLFEQVEALAAQLHPNATVREFEHPWAQRSILLHIPGSDAQLTRERGLVILGAHLDSTNFISFLRSPGADDDGSGTVTLLEALRALAAAGWQPESSVEVHWYSGEEGGLLGSQAVAERYEEEGVKVRAMLQQDMTAFVRQGTEESVGIVTDYVSPALTDYVERLVRAYLDIPPKRTQLGYGGSDHASWRRAGYESAFAIEAPFELCNQQRIHTSQDVASAPEFSFPHLLRFVRLSMAFVVELSGWS